MKMTEGVRKYAAAEGFSEDGTLKERLQANSSEFAEKRARRFKRQGLNP